MLRGNRQPAGGGLAINQGHPLSSQLAFAYVGNGVERCDLVSKKYGAFSGAVRYSLGEYGRAVRFNSTGPAYINFGTGLCNDLMNGSWTVALYYYLDGDVDGTLLEKMLYGSNIGWNVRYSFGTGHLHCSHPRSSSDAQVRINVFSGTYASLSSWRSVVFTSTGGTFSAAASAHAVYFDGQPATLASGSTLGGGTCASDSAQELWVGRGDTGTLSAAAGPHSVAFAVLARRAWSAGEAALFHADGYGLVAQHNPRRVYFVAAAGGGTTIYNRTPLTSSIFSSRVIRR